MDNSALLQQIKESVPLVDAAEALGIEFANKTGNAWKMKCFLHEEKEPSMVFAPDRGLFNCFSTGCIGRGDVINLYMLYLNLDFNEAVRKIALDWGVAGPEAFEDGKTDGKSRLVKLTTNVINELGAFLFKDKQAAHVRAHLKKRGVSPETALAFMVGFSPSCDFAERVGRKAGLTTDEMKTLQFNKPSLFGGRIVLPIICPRRSGIFYYGTLVKPLPNGPKYMGATGEHPLKWKGPMFGLHEARNHVRAAKTLIMVEGFFDALALHSAGIKNVVGSLGANVSPDQFEVMKSFSVPSVTVLFDDDRGGDAGIHSVIRNSNGLRTHIAFVPDVDPDEYVIANGVAALRAIIEQSISPIDFLVAEAAMDFENGTIYTKSDRLAKLLSAVKTMPAHESAVAVAEVARISGVPIDQIQDLMTSIDVTLNNPAESEKVVLAGAMQDPELFNRAELRIGSRSVWSVQRHRAIWEAMSAARKKEAAMLTPDLIRIELPATSKIENFLEELEMHTTLNYDYHLNVTCDAAVRRGLQSAGRQLTGDAANKGKILQDIVAKHMMALATASTTRTQIEFTAKEQVRGAMEYIHEQMANGGKIPGLNLGERWHNIMEATLGFQPSRTYLLSALPKSCKTTTAMNWALEFAVEQNVPLLWLNGEMSERDLALRNLSILSGISSTRLQRGSISAKEKEIVDAAAARYHASPLCVVNSAGMTVHDAINAMRKAVYNDGAKIVFLDYIQLLRCASSSLSYWERHMEISTELKNAMSKLPVPLIAVSQQSKASMNAGDGGGGANQGGSFKYVQDVDVVMDLKRRAEEDVMADGNGNLVLTIDYNRHGPQDVFTNLTFNTDNLRVEETA